MIRGDDLVADLLERCLRVLRQTAEDPPLDVVHDEVVNKPEVAEWLGGKGGRVAEGRHPVLFLRDPRSRKRLLEGHAKAGDEYLRLAHGGNRIMDLVNREGAARRVAINDGVKAVIVNHDQPRASRYAVVAIHVGGVYARLAHPRVAHIPPGVIADLPDVAG